MKRNFIKAVGALGIISNIFFTNQDFGICLPNKVYAAQSEESQKLYSIGSVSKMYVVTAAMQLAKEGKLDIDNPVVDYVPDFIMKDERYKDITVRMLMNHRSGLMGTTQKDAFMIGTNTSRAHDKFLERLSKQRLKADPGTFGTYCNDGFTLLEIVVERVSGEDFTSYIENHISKPLSGIKTGTPINRFNDSAQAAIYINGTQIENDYVSVIGAGGMLSTSREVAMFGASFFKGNETLLNENTKLEMTKKESYNLFDGETGLGWDYVGLSQYDEAGVDVVYKGGDTLSQHAALLVAPDEKISVAVLSSGGESMSNLVMAESLLNEVLLTKGIEIKMPEAKEKELVNTVPDEYIEKAGLYANNTTLYELSFPEMKYMKVETNTGKNIFTDYYMYTKDDDFVKMEGEPLKENFVQAANAELLSFETKDNKNEYLRMESPCEELEDLGSNHLAQILAQKLEENDISDSVLKGIKTKEGKYYLETAAYYDEAFWEKPVISVKLVENAKGYMFTDKFVKIVSSDEADSFITIPGHNGRDLDDYKFIEKNSKSYVEIPGQDYNFISEKNITEFDRTTKTVELNDDEAKWFTIGDDMKNGVIELELSKNSAVYIYDKLDTVTYSSFMKDYGNTVALPSEGKIMFVGDNGSYVNITVK